MRVWLHCEKVSGVHKLMYSPDTDVYHIGLTIVSRLQECEVIVQLSKYTDKKARYFNMTNMIALSTDPDLFEVHPQERPQLLQSIYVATGCDYTSFFNGLGKVTLLATFYQHAAFIAGRNSPPGTMGDISMDTDSDAKFSFLWLIGCAYYKQHYQLFTHRHLKLFSASNATTTYDYHTRWLAIIRTTVRQRADMETKSMPSTEALLLHWRRCIWVVAMWHCATMESTDPPDVLHLSHMHVHTT